MIHLLLKTKQFIPTEFHDSFFDIDFQQLYKSGKRIILTDLDNTLISYEENKPTKVILDKIKELETMGFEVVLISNNSTSRIVDFCEGTNLKGFGNARKPLKIGFKRALNSTSLNNKEKTIIVGDQLMTDIFGANRFKVDSILVNPLKKKTEKWYTKINRKIENRMLIKIKKKYKETYQLLCLDKRK